MRSQEAGARAQKEAIACWGGSEAEEAIAEGETHENGGALEIPMRDGGMQDMARGRLPGGPPTHPDAKAARPEARPSAPSPLPAPSPAPAAGDRPPDGAHGAPPS